MGACGAVQVARAEVRGGMLCEGLPPRSAGRLHTQEASHTLGSGWPKASPPTSPTGGSHRQIRERQRAGARPQHGQVLPEPRSNKIRTPVR